MSLFLTLRMVGFLLGLVWIALYAAVGANICTEAQIEDIVHQLKENRHFAKEPPTEKQFLRGTSCPSALWLEKVAKFCGTHDNLHMSHPKVLVIGGNKAYDCIGWARFFASKDKEELFTAELWGKRLRKVHSGLSCGVCNQCREDYPTSQAKPRSHHVYCVEAAPVNYNLIEQALQDTEEGDLRYAVTMINAAATLSVGTGAVNFTAVGKAGFEQNHIMVEDLRADAPPMAKETAHAPTVRVPAMSASEIVHQYMGGTPPSVLTIDTEGWDGHILLSAASILATGHISYIEFEYNNFYPWVEIRLQLIIDYLDSMKYDCFWAHNNGRLYPLTGCHSEQYENEGRTWSNVVCVHRKHSCWYDALSEHVYQPVI
mmetsp:Transcript_20412/g.34185  ORF Transcript_20412/g.34185 Transcript_20412/m.34185 type:complete len:372 (-) Transcript_20412:314-1429(-)